MNDGSPHHICTLQQDAVGGLSLAPAGVPIPGRRVCTVSAGVRLAVLAVLLVLGLVACSSHATPPGPDKALGTTARGGYLFLRWKEGLEVMIWHDLAGEGTTQSAGFSAGRLYIERGAAHSADGQNLTWEAQTASGRMGELHINGSRYNLAAGNVFMVTTQGGATTVRQIHRDLSAVPLDHVGIVDFAREDPDLATFLGETTAAAPPTTAPTSPPVATATTAVTPTPSATARSAAPTATPHPPTATPQPAPAVERILFAPRATHATIDGYLPVDGRAMYVMGVAASQFIEVNATAGTAGQGLRFSVTGADGSVVKPMGPAHIRTLVPSTQDYYVELASDVGATDYRLSVLIPVRIRFAPGATSSTVTGSLEERQMRHYVLRALGGQRMIVAPHASVGQVGLIIAGVDGQVLLSGRAGLPGGVFDGILPTSQDYLITVQAQGGTGADYALDIIIPVGEASSDVAIVGTVMDVSPSARTIALADPVAGFSVVALTEDSELLSGSGQEILLRDVGAGMRIQASGQPGAPEALIATQVLVLAN